MFWKKYPKINIKHSKTLDSVFIDYCKAIPKYKDWVPPQETEIKEKVKIFRETWKKYETSILKTICKSLNLYFPQNIIDVYVVSGTPRSFSDPVVMKSRYTPEEFVDILAHELIHKLLGINNVPKKIIRGFAPNESETTQNHILVHSLLKHLYIDILKDKERLENNIKRSEEHSNNDYAKAWKIVDDMGYKKILEKFLEMNKKNLRGGEATQVILF